jgi:hypothetical protein
LGGVVYGVWEGEGVYFDDRQYVVALFLVFPRILLVMAGDD